MSVIEKAKELGRELSESEEMGRMKDAEAMMLQNPEAKEITNEFNTKQRAFQMIISQGQQLTEGQKKEADDLEKKMMDNPYIYNFFMAQQDFEKIIQEINNIIGEAMGTAPSCDCGCSGDCSSGECV